MGLELEPWFLPRFPAHFSPQGFFLAGFFLASVLIAFALLAVAQLYEISRLLFVFFLYFCTLGLCCRLFILNVGVDDPQPNWQSDWHKA